MSHVTPEKVVFKGANLIPTLFAIAVGCFIWFLPIPEGITSDAWHLFAVFVATIVALIGKALPMGGVSLTALTVLIVTQTLTMKQAFNGFSNSIVWLVFSAFLLSKSFIKTGLGMRIAYLFISMFGKKTLGLSYGIAATELMLAPAIPSVTARAGGIVFPIVKAIAISFESTPERHSQRLIGSFLILSAYYVSLITSAMFITAMAANPLIISVLAGHGYGVSWGQWALAGLLPGLISLAAIPYLVFKLYPPEIKDTPDAKRIALEHLQEMGKVSKYEWITICVFSCLILLWIMGEAWNIDSTIVALAGVTTFILTGVLTWEDIKREQDAWDTFIWFATLLTMATLLNEFGLIKWLSGHIQLLIGETVWWAAWPALVAFYFYSHYLFAGNTTHVASMYAAFLSVGIALGIPPYLLAFSLAFSSSLFACLTHYGNGSAPIFFGSEYVNLKTWWKMGFIVSLFLLLIWIGVGSFWWKILGFW